VQSIALLFVYVVCGVFTMTLTDILWGIAIFAVSSMATWLYKDRNTVTREEVRGEIDAHHRACVEVQRTLYREQGKQDDMRNGRLTKLEEIAATKQDIDHLRTEMKELKTDVKDEFEELKRWITRERCNGNCPSLKA